MAAIAGCSYFRHQWDFDSLQSLEPFIGRAAADSDSFPSPFNLTGLVDDYLIVVTVLHQFPSVGGKCPAIVGTTWMLFYFQGPTVSGNGNGKEDMNLPLI